MHVVKLTQTNKSNRFTPQCSCQKLQKSLEQILRKTHGNTRLHLYDHPPRVGGSKKSTFTFLNIVHIIPIRAELGAEKLNTRKLNRNSRAVKGEIKSARKIWNSKIWKK